MDTKNPSQYNEKHVFEKDHAHQLSGVCPRDRTHSDSETEANSLTRVTSRCIDQSTYLQTKK